MNLAFVGTGEEAQLCIEFCWSYHLIYVLLDTKGAVLFTSIICFRLLYFSKFMSGFMNFLSSYCICFWIPVARLRACLL